VIVLPIFANVDGGKPIATIPQVVLEGGDSGQK